MVQTIKDAVLNNPTVAALLSLLQKDQQWANNVPIQSKGLMDDKEEDWATIRALTDARNHLLAINVAAPTTALFVISIMANNQSVLTTDSTPKETAPVKRSPQ